jgi:peptide/nickel transport system substrate-binding protein
MSVNYPYILISFGLLLSLLASCAAPTSMGPAVDTEQATSAPEQIQPTEAIQATGEAAEVAVLRIGGTAEPDCFHPFGCSDHWFFVNPIYESFSWYGPGCEPIPRLAESMESSEDGLTWTMKIRQGGKFSNGDPLDANAVKEFWDWMTGVEVGSWYPPTRETVSTAVLDDYTFSFTTGVPIGSWETYDSFWQWTLPPSIWAQLDDDSLWDEGYENPVGSGPYMLTEWASGEYLIYDANPYYWGGAPAVDRIVYQIYANPDAVIHALLAGDIDLTDPQLSPQYYDTLKNGGNVTLVETPPGFWYYLAFNLAEGANKHPAVEDPAVREAIDYAIDKQQILDVALLGHGYTCPNSYGCGPSVEPYLDPSLIVTPFDLERAKAILGDAGYLDTDGDGVRESPDGQALELRFYFSEEQPEAATMSSMIKGWLDQIGISVTPEAMESGTLWQTAVGERDFDIIVRYFGSDFDPSYMDFTFSCWSAEAGTGALNDSGYCNPELDDLLYEQMATVGLEKRLPIMYQAEGVLYRDRPWILLAAPTNLQAYRSDRFEFPHDTCSALNGMWDFYGLSSMEVVR